MSKTQVFYMIFLNYLVWGLLDIGGTLPTPTQYLGGGQFSEGVATPPLIHLGLGETVPGFPGFPYKILLPPLAPPPKYSIRISGGGSPPPLVA